MKKRLVGIFICSILLCSCVNGNNKTAKNEDVKVGESILSETNNTESEETEVRESLEDKEQEIVVGGNMNAKTFKEFYSMSDEIPESYIQAYIDQDGLTLEMLEDDRYDLEVQYCYEKGIVFGKDISLIIAESLDDGELTNYIMNAQKVILCVDKVGNQEFDDQEYAVLDYKEMKSYHSVQNVFTDYSKSEDIVDITEEQKTEQLEKLVEALAGIEELDESREAVNFVWRLIIESDHKTVKKFEGQGDKNNLQFLLEQFFISEMGCKL